MPAQPDRPHRWDWIVVVLATAAAVVSAGSDLAVVLQGCGPA
ncbi:hypothetical protein [Catenuloplanes atrovinosus]|uniref:Uncharacterized protein n=1 Tax=Catenuloplanes atrovinosus TaxID=137266 RepID=A0AAE4CDP5_9ACTN|nr:hypothetical protein [Catenuloplanes atrovinosus]MDR7277740.1 hypothetical protein [Catenuloplanes atrovinosus]